jgi:transposase-like protein
LKQPEKENQTMADNLSMALAELLRKSDAKPDLDTLREGIRVMTQALMELEVAQHLGAERYQRSPDRQGERNGYRDRTWDTRVGTLELRVPRVRDGSFFPGMLEPRKRAERALVATVREAYVQGVSTRRVDDLVKALGLDGISKSQVSRLCEELDTEVERFRTRKLDGAYPYVWVDATFLKVRQDHRVVNMAVVIAVGLNAATGQREVLGVDVGPSEDGAFWLRFLRALVARGLAGVQLVISDSHQGLKGAIAAVLQGAGWQRCRTHFMRNALCLVPKGTQQMVAATIRTVFVQPDAATAREQWRRVADQLRARFPRVAQLLDDAEDEVLAYLAFPQEHWRQIWSINPQEMAWTQHTIPPRQPAERDDVANLHLRSIHDHPLDQQLDQCSLLSEGGSLQALRHSSSELLDASSHHLNVSILLRLDLVPLLVTA